MSDTFIMPPAEAELRVHMGGCVVEMDAEKKLPSGAVAWGWDGSPWHPPAAWHLGVYADGEREKELLEARLAAQEEAHENNFDERGQVDHIDEFHLDKYIARLPPEKKKFPPGVTFRPPE